MEIGQIYINRGSNNSQLVSKIFRLILNSLSYLQLSFSLSRFDLMFLQAKQTLSPSLKDGSFILRLLAYLVIRRQMNWRSVLSFSYSCLSCSVAFVATGASFTSLASLYTVSVYPQLAYISVFFVDLLNTLLYANSASDNSYTQSFCRQLIQYQKYYSNIQFVFSIYLFV